MCYVSINTNVYIVITKVLLILIFRLFLSILLLTQPYIDESTDIKHRNFKISKKLGINDLGESKDLFFKKE